MTPYKIKRGCYLLRHCLVVARRMLLFRVEQIFLPMGEVWSMHNEDTQCRVGGGGGQRAEKNFYVYIFLVLP